MHASIVRASMTALTLIFFSGLAEARPTVTLGAAKDNTLFEDPSGQSSDGAGDSIFAGRTGAINDTVRRALLQFDLTSIPAGSTVTSVSLKLTMLQTISGAYPASLHRCAASWGEGASGPSFGESEGGGFPAQTGDATWLHRFYATSTWTTAGGDFAAGASATTSVDQVGDYTWSSAQLTADVQSWVNNPASNNGWVLRGDEAATGSAKRYGSRAQALAADRPALTVTYTPPCPGDINGDGRVNTADLTQLLGNFGHAVTPNTGGDLNGDGFVNTADLTALLGNFGRVC